MHIITGHQPVYLPWLGLFHKIALADTFVFMDDVQYLSQDWNNRNFIKGAQGKVRLTVPVRLKASSSDLLKDIVIADDGWGTKRHWQTEHWKSLQACYARAPFWQDHADFFETFYTERPWKWLAEMNLALLGHFLEVFDIRVKLIKASEEGYVGTKSDLVLDHCRRLDADVCIFGTQGRDYVAADDFFAEGTSIHFQDYRHPEYQQRFDGFISHLSVCDLLFNHGPKSRDILLAGNVTAPAIRAAATAAKAGVLEPEV
jgi:hypothetical protein